jgi:hypothetical protein
MLSTDSPFIKWHMNGTSVTSNFLKINGFSTTDTWLILALQIRSFLTCFSTTDTWLILALQIRSFLTCFKTYRQTRTKVPCYLHWIAFIQDHTVQVYKAHIPYNTHYTVMTNKDIAWEISVREILILNTFNTFNTTIWQIIWGSKDVNKRRIPALFVCFPSCPTTTQWERYW